MNTLSIEEFIDQAKQLPPSPEILPKLLEVLQDDDASNWEIARLIHMDQSLTTQVLTWSNSGYYGYTEKCTDIEEALSRVGFGEVYKLVGIVMSKRLLNQPAGFYALDPGQLWENSLTAAFTMETLAGKLGHDENISYTIGLLHGIGKVVINELCQDSYEQVFDLVDNHASPLCAAEKQVIGFDHAEIGEALLKKWNFPLKIYEPVGNQYTPFSAEYEQDLACIMNISHYVVSAIGGNFGRASMAIQPDPKSFEKLKMNVADMQMTMIEAQEKVADVKAHLAMGG